MDDLQQRHQARERGGSAPSLASLVTNRCFLTLRVIRIWNTNRSFLDRTQTRIFLEFLFNSDKNYSIAFLDKTDPKAISYNVLILKTENGGFSTFAGVLDPGPDSPDPRVKHACEGAENSILGFRNKFIVRDGLRPFVVRFFWVQK